MKIIDLLNKIANGEELPEKIKYRNKIFIYDKDNQCYVVENYNEYDDLHMSLSNHKGIDLNYEVEIKEEEKKIPEKLKSLNNVGNSSDIGEFKDKQQLNNNLLKDKLNEIIKYLNYLKSKGDE